MIHQFKTDAKNFEAVTNGSKSFEIRKSGRAFMVGDFLALNECSSEPEHFYTGRCCIVEILYVLADSSFVKDGYVVLGIRPCPIGGVTQISTITSCGRKFTQPPGREEANV